MQPSIEARRKPVSCRKVSVSFKAPPSAQVGLSSILVGQGKIWTEPDCSSAVGDGLLVWFELKDFVSLHSVETSHGDDLVTVVTASSVVNWLCAMSSSFQRQLADRANVFL